MLGSEKRARDHTRVVARRQFTVEKRETRMTSGTISAVSAAVVVLCAPAALAGPDWIEIGDAGSVIGTAQPTFGDGPLRTIAGSLSLGAGMADFEDMYLITVLDPSKFSMTLTGATFDAQLFVFNVTLPGEAFGLLGNQSTINGNIPFLDSMSTDGSGAQLTQPGVYAIAISGMGRAPVSNTGEIFDFAIMHEVSGPDGPGGINPHIGWTGIGEVGTYVIELEGAGFYALPGAGTLALLVLTGGTGGRSRRRRR